MKKSAIKNSLATAEVKTWISGHSRINTGNVIVISVALLVVSVIPFFLTHNQAIAYTPWNYLITQSLVFLMLTGVERADRNEFFLSPSFIAVSYVNLNFLIGSIAFMKGMVFVDLLEPYAKWENMPLVIGYFNLVNLVILDTYFISPPQSCFKTKLISDFRAKSTMTLLLIALLLLVVFSFLGVDLSFFSGEPSNFYIIPKTLGAIMIFVILFRTTGIKRRLFFYALIILFFSVASYEDKREAVFLLLPILVLESTRYSFNLNLKKIVLGTIVTSFIIFLILVMSILRGYGSYNPKGFLDAIGYVPQYVKSDFFIPAFLNNLEISYTYLHSNNAVEYVIEDPSKLSLGSTIAKPLFIATPRTYFPDKPESIIELYTSSFSKAMRQEGYSAPVSLQSELFWNFHFFGIFFAPILFFVFNWVYLKIVRLIETDNIINFVPLLFIYQQSLVLFRGSGLDQFIVDVILSFAFFVTIKIILRICSQFIEVMVVNQFKS